MQVSVTPMFGLPMLYKSATRHHLRLANTAFSEGVLDSMLVLDAGAGRAPYQHLFQHATYESADFQKVDKKYSPVTYVCDLSAIPVDAERYDRVVCNQVLEHLPHPAAVLSEFHRVMKDDGLVICTCPFFWEEHEQPYDFFRYTQFGLKKLFEDAGFQIEKIDWLEGFFGTLGYQMWRTSKHINIFPRKNKPTIFSKSILRNPVGILALPFLFLVAVSSMFGAFIFSRLDRMIKVTDRGYPLNYVVVARKVSTSETGS